MSFLWTKKLLFDKTTWSNDKTKVSCTEKKAPKIFWTYDQNHGLTRFKICQFFAIVKCGFYGLKILLLTKQHQQTTTPMSLLQKWRLERYLELLARIMSEPVLKYANFSTIVKCRFYGLKSLLLTKQHDQTTKTKVSCTVKWAWKMFLTFDENHGLTRFKICKFSTILKYCFYGLKSLLLTKQHDQTTKTRSLVQKSWLIRYLELMTRIMG